MFAQIIPSTHLKLIRAIGNGHRYFLHAGEHNGRAVIVKVFNSGPTARQDLEATVALSKGLWHSNVLRIEGISSPSSSTHFIAYENAHWQNAEGPLAAAPKIDLTKCITLGLKMIAGLSAGINYLGVQRISLRVTNFDIFLDVHDRFLISINPCSSGQPEVAVDIEDSQEDKSWNVFNALCQKVLRSVNRLLHTEDIDRHPVTLEPTTPRNPSTTPASSAQSVESAPPENISDQSLVPPRREYVWRTLDRGRQSLATVASRVAFDIDMGLSPLNRLTWTNGQSPHRCSGYIREEITLATTAIDSAVVCHDTPSPREICTVCHEVVGLDEVFECICGDSDPGLRHTLKCRTCNRWSHRNCVGNPDDFTCQHCIPVPVVPSPQVMMPPVRAATPTHSLSDIEDGDFPFLLPLSEDTDLLGPTVFQNSVQFTSPTRRASMRRRKKNTNPDLRVHTNSHFEVKHYECGECGHRFDTPRVLKRHQRECPLMKSELSAQWEWCLLCGMRVVDGSAYCSDNCRLADLR
ncbi:hypothetical protein K438DRAFT_1807207 [Mycena galopus ATCC 62051]|nr:hypothetical protein K438DRAFT_1807207 [Mycena galopus ATCC 62051]